MSYESGASRFYDRAESGDLQELSESEFLQALEPERGSEEILDEEPEHEVGERELAHYRLSSKCPFSPFIVSLIGRYLEVLNFVLHCDGRRERYEAERRWFEGHQVLADADELDAVADELGRTLRPFVQSLGEVTTATPRSAWNALYLQLFDFRLLLTLYYCSPRHSAVFDDIWRDAAGHWRRICGSPEYKNFFRVRRERAHSRRIQASQ